MSAQPDVAELLEALERSSVRVGREDEDAERAGAWAASRLDSLDDEGLRALWTGAREAGLSLKALFSRVETAIAVPCAHAPLLRGLARTIPVDATFEVRCNVATTLHYELEDTELAAQLMEETLLSLRGDANAWLVLGVLREALEDVAGAIEAFETSGELTDDYGPWLNLGQLLKAEGRYPEACAAMARCCERDDEAEHLHVWGHVLLLSGEEARGDESLARAESGYSRRIKAKQRERRWNERVDEELAPSFFWRGAARCLRGNLAGAKRDLAKAVAGSSALSSLAREEEDYAALRATPAWAELVGR